MLRKNLLKKNMSEEKKGEGFMLGFLIGGLIGAAASFLLGVEEGNEIKRTIKKKGKILLDGAKDSIVEGEELIKRDSEELKTFVENKIQETEKTVVKEVAKKVPRSFRHFFFKSGKKLSK